MVLLVTARAGENSHEPVSSTAAYAHFLAGKFQHLVDKLDRLELKLDRIVLNGYCRPIEEIVNGTSPATTGTMASATLVLNVTTTPASSIKESSPAEKIDPGIYFASALDGILSYSILTSQVNTIVSSNESCYGIAFDSIHQKIYWSTYSGPKIYRANVDGSHVETVLSTRQCKYGIAFFEILIPVFRLKFPIGFVICRRALSGVYGYIVAGIISPTLSSPR